MVTGDILATLNFVRRLDLAVRAPGAMNLAIAQRLGAVLVTFNKRIAAVAGIIGLVLWAP